MAFSYYKTQISVMLLVVAIFLAIISGCGKRFWFRKKVGNAQQTDSVEVEKKFNIVW